MFRARTVAAVLAALAVAGPLPAGAAGDETRTLADGFLYVGAAPGFNFGGRSLPHALYMDVFQAGYVFPPGVDLSFALSGMNFFPDEGEYAITMSRFQFAFRPFLRDPLPIIQPYALVGLGFGGEGRYRCEREDGREVCERDNWAGTTFGGVGFDLNAHLADLAGQQLLVYGGVQARYEFIFTHADYRMPVITFPVGLRLQ